LIVSSPEKTFQRPLFIDLETRIPYR
jgi:hypothetical protein